MTKYPINIDETGQLLAEGRLSELFDRLANVAEGFPALAPMRREIASLREQYGYMADYALRGLPDPGLAANHAAVADRLRSIADTMLRTLMIADAPTLYYSMLRTASVTPQAPVGDLVATLRHLRQRLSLAALAENAADASRELTSRAETTLRDLFNRLWTTHPLSSQDAEAVTILLGDKAIPDSDRQLAVSALTLGLTEWFDERKLMLLFDAYTDGSTVVSVRALCGILLTLWFYRTRPLSAALRQRFDTVRELPSWTSDVRLASMQFIRARDTERVTRKFNEEVLPEMLRMRPEIEKLSREPISPESIEENPEWAEMLDKSGLTDKLREMQEMQEQGDDVMMATFSQLKTFSFFHEVSAWFTPFTASRSEFLTPASAPFIPLLEMLESSPAFCDSDKYSVALSLSQIPEAQRSLITSQMQAHSEQFDAMRAASAGVTSDRADAGANYVRSLYRFFKLFRRKGEFRDPFADGLNLPALPALGGVFDDAETLSLIGEFYFSRRYWADAFEIFDRLDRLTEPSAALYQKMGYARQMLGDTPEALRYYEQSEMLDAASAWTRRRLAACHRAMGNYESALRYYRSLADDRPDDVSLALNTGLCLVKLRRYDEALQSLFKAEYLGSSSPKAMRAIAWCTLLGGDYDRARTYTDRLLALPDPTATDLLNAGHLELLTGHPDRAASLYARSIAARGDDAASFRADLMRDFASVDALRAIDPIIRAIVADRACETASRPR